MWIRKTDEELRQKENIGLTKLFIFFGNLDNINPVKGFIYVFISFFVFQIVLEQILGIPTHGRYTPGPPHNIKISLKDIPDRLPYYFKLSLFVGIAFVLFSLYVRKFKITKEQDSKRKDYVCEKCNMLKTDDGIYTCECGGEYIHIDKMKWIDNE